MITIENAKVGETYVNQKETLVFQVEKKEKEFSYVRVIAPFGYNDVLKVPNHRVIKDNPRAAAGIISQYEKAVRRIRSFQATNEVKKKPKEAKPKRVINSKTGFAEGTKAHRVGLIMLDNKDQETCIKLIEKMLLEYDEPAKAKKMARLWYWNHISKKPEIYK